MIGAHCFYELPDGELLRGTIVGENEDVTMNGGPVWKVRLDKAYLHSPGGPTSSWIHVAKDAVFLEQ